MAGQRPLGELLVEMGFIDEDQLRWALDQQRVSDRRIGKIIVDAGLLTEERLVRALARQLGIDTCDPINTPVHPRVRALLTARAAHRYGLVPIALTRDETGQVLYVATADPLDREALDFLRMHFGTETRIRYMLSGETEIALALARHYGADTPSSPAAGAAFPRVPEPAKVRPSEGPRAPSERPLEVVELAGGLRGGGSVASAGADPGAAAEGVASPARPRRVIRAETSPPPVTRDLPRRTKERAPRREVSAAVGASVVDVPRPSSAAGVEARRGRSFPPETPAVLPDAIERPATELEEVAIEISDDLPPYREPPPMARAPGSEGTPRGPGRSGGWGELLEPRGARAPAEADDPESFEITIGTPLPTELDAGPEGGARAPDPAAEAPLTPLEEGVAEPPPGLTFEGPSPVAGVELAGAPQRPTGSPREPASLEPADPGPVDRAPEAGPGGPELSQEGRWIVALAEASAEILEEADPALDEEGAPSDLPWASSAQLEEVSADDLPPIPVEPLPAELTDLEPLDAVVAPELALGGTPGSIPLDELPEDEALPPLAFPDTSLRIEAPQEAAPSDSAVARAMEAIVVLPVPPPAPAISSDEVEVIDAPPINAAAVALAARAARDGAVDAELIGRTRESSETVERRARAREALVQSARAREAVRSDVRIIQRALQEFVAGGTLEGEGAIFMLRVAAAVLMNEGLLDEQHLERAILTLRERGG